MCVGIDQASYDSITLVIEHAPLGQSIYDSN
jgi:hypothetical protein